MKLKDLNDARRFATDHGISVASIGDTPFFVSGLEDLIPVRFVSSLRSEDGTFPGFETFYAGDLPGGRPRGDRLTIDEILMHSVGRRWLQSSNVSGVLVWDYDEASECNCQQAGIKLLASPRNIVRELEDKVDLQSTLGALGLPTLPHIITTPAHPPSWDDILALLGGDVVVQGAANNLNGKYTYRARTRTEFNCIIAQHSGEPLKVTTAVSGGSFNLSGVVLPHQFVPGIGTTQLVGIPQLIDLPFGYCGNEAPVTRWFGNETLDAAWRGLEHLSEFARTRGYRGLLGVDFVVDQAGVPYIVDVNPRMQSSQGLVTAAQMESGLPPILFLHILHHLGFEVTVDTDRYWSVARGSSLPLSQVVIFHIGEPDFGSGSLRPGRYDLLSGNFESLGTSLNGVLDTEKGVLHRACEEGRHLLRNSTMLAIQARRPVLLGLATLQPWIISLVQSLRERALMSSSDSLNRDLIRLPACESVRIG